jgi:GMP synthase-like glutamine amidotransferase
VPFEGPAAFADWAGSHGHTLDCVELYANQSPPEVNRYDMLLVMGGPMNIYEESKYSWLAAEKAAIRAAIDAGKVVVGICLGAQLLADALGAEVRRGNEVEIGWLPIERTAGCPGEIALPDSLRVYHWHGDTFEIPEGAVHIASSAACTNQGFLYQGRVLGLQCHLETTRESIHALIEACGHEIQDGRYVQDGKTMRTEPDATFEVMQSVLFKLLDRITGHV